MVDETVWIEFRHVVISGEWEVDSRTKVFKIGQ
ncbi:hypothetical protein SAMN05444412_11319 [Rhodonellum ikkaensis]|uniref:Uncharacterized protein n=1 Tax=Rhodonellum ikkaensis TaxID=336829 RepID=A0A1H3SQG1_9BACT|nr:hypothetical protein SAMN05444412_11319 [Rhodonellum ikkaensis]